MSDRKLRRIPTMWGPLAALAAALALGAGGCGAAAGDDAAGAKPAADEDARPAATGTPTKDEVRRMGRGLAPQRGPVQVMPAGSVPVEFEPAQMDFGVLPPGVTVQGTSRIWNVGTEPLRIEKSITSCGCTAAEDLAGRVIPPGESIEFSTTMSMRSGVGEKKEKITVYFPGDRLAVQYYTAEVSLPIRLVPPHLAASQRTRGGGWTHMLTGRIRIQSRDGEPFRVLRTHGAPPDFVSFDPAADEPRSAYDLRWDLRRFGSDIPWFWVVETDRPDCPVVDARVRHASTLPARVEGRPWVPKDQRVLVGAVARGEPFEVTTKVEYHERIRTPSGSVPNPPRPATAAVATQSDFLQATLLEAQADGQFIQYRIELTATDDADPGLLYGQIAVFASGYSAPLRVIGRVIE